MINLSSNKTNFRVAKTLYIVLVLAFGMLITFAKPSYSNELNNGVKLYNQREYKKALRHFDSYLLSHPKSAYAYYYSAMCYQQLGQSSKAISNYRKVKVFSPESKIGKYASDILRKLDSGVSKKERTLATVQNNAERNGKERSKIEKVRDTSGDNIPNVARVHLMRGNKALTIPVKINGKVVPMVLDTGAPTTLMYRSSLYLINKGTPKRPYDGYSGGVSLNKRIGYWLIPVTLQVGPILKKNFEVRFLDAQRGFNLLGQDFYKEFDYTKDNQTILFTKKGYYKNVVSSDNSIPFKFVKEGNRIVVKAKFGKKFMPVILDTGNTAAGIHFHSAHQARKYGVPVPARAKKGSTRGTTGTSSVYYYSSLTPVSLGPVFRKNPSVTVNATGDMMRHKLVNNKESLANFDAFLPLLGQSFLNTHRYTIDMKNRKIHFSR